MKPKALGRGRSGRYVDQVSSWLDIQEAALSRICATRAATTRYTERRPAGERWKGTPAATGLETGIGMGTARISAPSGLGSAKERRISRASQAINQIPRINTTTAAVM